MTPAAHSSQTTLQLAPSSRTLGLPGRPAPVQSCVNSTDILRGQKAVDIEHNGSTYKLQATRLGKLILTK